MTFQKKKPSVEEALPKIRTYCNFRDRSHKEVKTKLYDMGLYTREVDELLIKMMDEGLLNEERYAKSFARGHFYQKKWGWIKIEMGLRQHGIQANLMKAAKNEIDPEDYDAMVRKLAERKWNEFKKDQYITRKAKVYRFLDWQRV